MSSFANPSQESIVPNQLKYRNVHPFENHPGMTLRHHYAGQMMAALIPHYGGEDRCSKAAETAVQAADALLNVLERKP